MGDLGDLAIWEGEVMDSKRAGKAPPPRPKMKPMPCIDGAYLVILESRTVEGFGRTRWCTLRKQGGGFDVTWELNPGDDWKQIVREFVEPD